MADTLTQDGAIPGVNKTFSLSTTNTLFGTSRFFQKRLISTFGRPFIPTRVTISYAPYTHINVFNTSLSSASGFASYYDPKWVTGNSKKQTPVSSATVNISQMPAWLSALVLPYI